MFYWNGAGLKFVDLCTWVGGLPLGADLCCSIYKRILSVDLNYLFDPDLVLGEVMVLLVGSGLLLLVQHF